MNPQLFGEIDFSFFTSFFSSKDEDEENKKKKEQKSKNKKSSKNTKKEKTKSPNKSSISKKDSYKSSETTYSEEDNTTKKSGEKEMNSKKEKKDKKEKKEEKKEENNYISLKEKKQKKEKPTKDDYLINLVNYIKNVYLFRKQAKNLVKKMKENYAIISSVNKNNLHMNIFVNEEKIKKLKYTYEPILNENIFYIPRKALKKKNLLKFSFVNNKNESIIDPKFNTEYDSGEFINVINLKKIKDKEEEREEEFQTFLESYYTLKPAFSKESIETKKLSLGVVRVKKKHKTMDGHKGGFSFGMHKVPSNSILKQRPIKRVTSNKKITFSEKNETIAYKKDD